MPFSVVLTSEEGLKYVSIAPDRWLDKENNLLYWPRDPTKSELDMLQRNENSMPMADWRKIECKIKASNIKTFAEAIKIEALYSSFRDTEDEERYYKKREIKRKHPTQKIYEEDLLDLNSDFDTEEKEKEPTMHLDQTVNIQSIASPTPIIFSPLNQDHTILSTQSTENPEQIIVISQQNEAGPSLMPSENYTNKSDENTKVTDDDGEYIHINISELKQIMAQNDALVFENKVLKESNLVLKNQHKETQRGFGIIQVQLDKIFDLLHHKSLQTETVNKEDSVEEHDTKIKFPINSKEQLDFLENALDTKLEEALVKFSKICGTGGNQKLSKIGLQVVKNLFTDELLSQLSWKGIKGCTKVPFLIYIKTRYLFFKIVHLADSTCTSKDTDLFLQNSAIKHSNQRLKRKLSEVKESQKHELLQKKNKIEQNNEGNRKDEKGNEKDKTQNRDDQEVIEKKHAENRHDRKEVEKKNAENRDDQNEIEEEHSENRDDQKEIEEKNAENNVDQIDIEEGTENPEIQNTIEEENAENNVDQIDIEEDTENPEIQNKIEENLTGMDQKEYDTENQKNVPILKLQTVLKEHKKGKKRTQHKQMRRKLEQKSINIAKPHKSNKSSEKVVVLSNVKIENKIKSINQRINMSNISSDNLLHSPVFKQNAEGGGANE